MVFRGVTSGSVDWIYWKMLQNVGLGCDLMAYPQQTTWEVPEHKTPIKKEEKDFKGK